MCHAFSDQKVRREVACPRTSEDDYIAGSGHRIASCAPVYCLKIYLLLPLALEVTDLPMTTAGHKKVIPKITSCMPQRLENKDRQEVG